MSKNDWIVNKSWDGLKMKVRIKIFNGELPDYLTLGKFYEVLNGDELGCDIVDDVGDILRIYPLCSSHLNDGSWEIVND